MRSQKMFLLPGGYVQVDTLDPCVSYLFPIPVAIVGANCLGRGPHILLHLLQHGEPSKAGDEDATESTAEAGLLEQMKQKLKTEAGRDLYRMRKAIVEPVFGQIKEWRGFRRFLLRGLQKVRAEWKLICLTHNLLKLFRSGRAWQMS
jgi:Transposase DDE domain